MDQKLKDEIIGDLIQLPLALNEKTTELYSLRKLRDDKVMVMKAIESALKIAIEGARDLNDKPQFSNALRRDAELERRKTIDQDYAVAEDEFNKLREKIENLSLVVEFMNNKFKSARALALLAGDEK